jgi:hypothetical protein
MVDHIVYTHNDDYCDSLLDALPHGSGIDADWNYSYNKHTGNATFTNGYHCMHECGMYDGWQDFSLVINIRQLKKGVNNFNLHFINGDYLSRKYYIRDYLEETFHYSINVFLGVE